MFTTNHKVALVPQEAAGAKFKVNNGFAVAERVALVEAVVAIANFDEDAEAQPPGALTLRKGCRVWLRKDTLQSVLANVHEVDGIKFVLVDETSITCVNHYSS